MIGYDGAASGAESVKCTWASAGAFMRLPRSSDESNHGLASAPQYSLSPNIGCGCRIRTGDLEVMSLPRYHCANPQKLLGLSPSPNDQPRRCAPWLQAVRSQAGDQPREVPSAFKALATIESAVAQGAARRTRKPRPISLFGRQGLDESALAFSGGGRCHECGPPCSDRAPKTTKPHRETQ